MGNLQLHPESEEDRKRLEQLLKANRQLSGQIEELGNRLGKLQEKQQQEVNQLYRHADDLLEKCKRIQPSLKNACAGWLKSISSGSPVYRLAAELFSFLEENAFPQEAPYEPFRSEKEKPASSSEKPTKKHPSSAELKQIYLRIARQFHPDKATSAEEAERFHQIMQTANLAFQSGDWNALLQLQEELENHFPDLIGSEKSLIERLETAEKQQKGLQFQTKQLFEEIGQAIRSQQTGGYKREVMELIARVESHHHKLLMTQATISEWLEEKAISEDTLEQLNLAFGGSSDDTVGDAVNKELAEEFLKEMIRRFS